MNTMDTNSKLAIQELLSRSAYALDERLLDMLQDTFSESAALVIDIAGADGEVRFDGRDAIMGLMTGSMAEQSDQRRHVVTNLFFESENADRATVISNVTITSVAPDRQAIRLVTSGLYRDEVVLEGGTVPEGGQWRIASRRIILDMAY
jgi:3-phenylpropionate/cinnamic acid dioxygenase small subunit